MSLLSLSCANNTSALHEKRLENKLALPVAARSSKITVVPGFYIQYERLLPAFYTRRSLGETETHCCRDAIVTTPCLWWSHCYDALHIQIPLLRSHCNTPFLWWSNCCDPIQLLWPHSYDDPIVTVQFLSRSHCYGAVLITIPLLRSNFYDDPIVWNVPISAEKRFLIARQCPEWF